MLTNYLLEIGDIVKLWPEDMRQGYRRIHIDHLLLLEGGNVNRIRSVLCESMTLSLEQAGLIVPKQTKLFTLVQSQLREILLEKEVLICSQRTLQRLQPQHSEAHEHAAHDIQQAEGLIKQALSPQQTEEYRDPQLLFQKAREYLMQALQTHTQHYYAWLLLGWLQRCIVHDNQAAIEAYQQAVLHSHKHDPDFSLFARRHLADAFEAAGQRDKALTTVKQTYQLSDDDYLDTQYEYLRYFFLCEDNAHTEIEPILGHLLRESLTYYPLLCILQQQTDSDTLHTLINRAYQDKISSLKMHIEMNWDKNPIHAVKLPDDVDVNAIFQQQLETHIPILYKTAFMELDDEAIHIEKSILRVTRGQIATQINNLLEQCRRKITHDETKYKWINRIGRGIFRFAMAILMIVFILGVYLLLQRFILPGELILPIPHWILLLLGSLLLFITGGLLRSYQSGSVRSLQHKQAKIHDMLERLHKSIQ